MTNARLRALGVAVLHVLLGGCTGGAGGSASGIGADGSESGPRDAGMEMVAQKSASAAQEASSQPEAEPAKSTSSAMMPSMAADTAQTAPKAAKAPAKPSAQSPSAAPVTPITKDDTKADTKDDSNTKPMETAKATPTTPMAAAQRPGDVERGRSLLLNNGTEQVPYLSCGIPKSLVGTLKAAGVDVLGDRPKLPERERGNAELPYSFSYAKTRSGVEVVSANCLMCHASQLGDSLVVGLGNPNMDFTRDSTSVLTSPGLVQDLVRLTLNDDEQVELERFLRFSRASGEVERADTVGMNPADVTFAVLAAHRDPDTLKWRDERDPAVKLDVNLVFSDVPALWNLHRRDRFFYNGFGRGDHARIMMTAALLCLEDTEEAAAIDAYFPDIEAYIKSMRPPSYETVAQRSIDMTMAGRGEKLYEERCKSCHGNSQQAPREDVAIDDVGTDPAYAIAASQQGEGAVAYFFDFFNRSWYGKHGAHAHLERAAEPVYSAPPLVGVWATAPYFHNGSVPTLDAVLDPALRPKIFRRSTDPKSYDFERMGWPYEEVKEKGDDTTVYDATRAEYLNTGHDYDPDLTAEQRRDLLEYLKTL